MQTRALIVGHDIASCQGLEALAQELEARSWGVASHLARGEKEYPDPTRLSDHIKAINFVVDAVILGMSSKPETCKEETLALRVALEANVPVFMYCDLANTWARPHFADLIRSKPSLVHFFVLSESSAKKVREYYPGVKAFVTGKPGWEQYGAPAHTRAEVRAMLGIPDEDKAILCPGGKNREINILHFGAVIEGAIIGAAMSFRSAPTVVLSVHGGDLARRDGYMFFEKWSDRSRVKVIVPPIPECKAPIILPGMDLVVASMSTIGEEAGFQRIPTINYISHIARQCHIRESGLDWWPPLDDGLEDFSFGSTDELARKIALCLNPDSVCSRTMRKKQESLLIPREPGTAARLMSQALEISLGERLDSLFKPR